MRNKKYAVCEDCGQFKVYCAKGLCKTCYSRLLQRKDYKDPDKRKKINANNRYYANLHPEWFINHLRSDVCDFLDAHHNDLIDDEERLSTQYILDMSKGVKPNGGKLYR